ncbi:MAG: glyoxalase [Gammaproteobacteria bacterium RIFCSPLOWO2_02_FULL_38_11]|nr:MAG: glyoxalase [Gammaproteobacteria bacterium RIFCSPHIGHO2_12_38_15]OGT66906.1 MAG: glyoxalase [Gammaproteobacteria bacterium RIFCSPLOWO2_02_FULL_38_11]OGT77241.1 MAG: glyoxalase [Gammaproteobacteria bacterium RIFCSPLOWO2_12_FULL_38_14]
MTLSTLGLRHLALTVKNLEACTLFYTQLLGMKIQWQPDKDNVYLSTGQDNLALHRAPIDFTPSPHQRLDHFGFFLEKEEDVEKWHTFLSENQVIIKFPIKKHRDGSKSFYCLDPDGNVIQMIYMRMGL